MITKSIAALDTGVVAQPHPEEFIVFGYQSADDAAAFFRGEQ